ncbi:hypothetical protein DFJ63DRAFT_312589 [Scheffersomyces coipomensis]|uniref:uncharacterized protein n=1 Tax=Scheffersomyces coipomensis TaxID=1788519 RepID=UPI00315DDE03
MIHLSCLRWFIYCIMLQLPNLISKSLALNYFHTLFIQIIYETFLETYPFTILSKVPCNRIKMIPKTSKYNPDKVFDDYLSHLESNENRRKPIHLDDLKPSTSINKETNTFPVITEIFQNIDRVNHHLKFQPLNSIPSLFERKFACSHCGSTINDLIGIGSFALFFVVVSSFILWWLKYNYDVKMGF